MKRKGNKRRPLIPILFGLFFCFLLLKIGFGYLAVAVVRAEESRWEDIWPGEFIVLRQERLLNAPCRGYFLKVKTEGERVAKDTTLGYLETTSGTSLEKKEAVSLKAPVAGIVSYEIDGLENICNPAVWRQLDLSKLETFLAGRDIPPRLPGEGNAAQNEGSVEPGAGICKIIDNLGQSYFYWAGEGAYPEKIKTGSKVSIRLEETGEVIFNGIVREFVRQTGKYGILVEILNLGNYNPRRYVTGEIIVQSYVGVVLPEKVLVVKNDQDGVYLFQKGRTCWQEVEKIAQLRGQVVLAGLTEKDWVIIDPQLVTEGKRIKRINK